MNKTLMYSQHQKDDDAAKNSAPSFMDSSPVQIMALFWYHQPHRKSSLSLSVNWT